VGNVKRLLGGEVLYSGKLVKERKRERNKEREKRERYIVN
jgi:hypothetical protein